jgi:NmrA-like family
VTAISREGSKNPIPAGAAVKKINYAEPSTIVEALKGQDVLIYSLSVLATDEADRLIKAAAEAGVPWILPNEFGYNSDNEAVNKDTLTGIPKKAQRQLIESLGVSSWIGIGSGYWYEYSLSVGGWSFGFDIKGREATFYDDGTTKIHTSSWPQIARAVVNLLSLPITGSGTTLSEFKNKFAFISSFYVNQQEIFESLLRVTGTTREDWKITNQPSDARFAFGKQMLQSGDRRGFGIALYSRTFFPDGSGTHPESANAALGLSEESIDELSAVAVKMVQESYFETKVIPRITPPSA